MTSQEEIMLALDRANELASNAALVIGLIVAGLILLAAYRMLRKWI